MKYSFLCEACGEVTEVELSIGEYHRNPPSFFHCGQHQVRYFPPTGLHALVNPLAGDRHYDGMQAPDGSDISSRTKHREYMKRNNLTTVDDFKGTWAAAEKQRDQYRTGKGGGAITRDDIARTWHQMTDR